MAFSLKKGQKRNPASRDFLQSAILDAVKQSDPACEPFVGVILERVNQSANEANWALRGIKFGRADRAKVNQALSMVVEKMQSEFLLSEDGPPSHGDSFQLAQPRPNAASKP